MAFAAILALTLVPALGVILIRGRIRSEDRHPISRVLFWLYTPVLNFVVRLPKTVITVALLLGLSTIPVFQRLGSEFMPPLNEGTILFMQTAVPADRRSRTNSPDPGPDSGGGAGSRTSIWKDRAIHDVDRFCAPEHGGNDSVAQGPE